MAEDSDSHLHTNRASHPDSDSLSSTAHPTTGHPPAGQAPYTRGIHSDMYRSRMWTMRQYAGFSDAGSTNAGFVIFSKTDSPDSLWLSTSRRN